MFDFEAVGAVRDFVELGGNVLLVIAFVTAVMWTLIIERFWYYRTGHIEETARIKREWEARADHSSWNAHQIRRMMISEVQQKLERGLNLIKTIVAVCPMFGLLGTVTGMIEVFDVMAIAGSGNARGMAGGVSKATLPTMAGMVAALSGMLFSIQLDRFARDESQRVSDQLEVIHD
ncbi:MAG: MotA/TolQ/ExbB proton channel family protein [Planctomycetota bacterium]|nr:MotA/TolQ/ExbB proton channel family protein [Planctomycetota bacterium]